MYLSSCLFNFVSSGLLVTPWCSCLCQPCLVLPRLVCLRSILLFESTTSSACSCILLVCALWQKTRPNNKRRPLTSFVFRFESLLCCSCLFVPRHGSRRSSSSPSPLQVDVGVVWDCHESAGREPLQPCVHEEIAAVGGFFKPAVRGEVHDAVRGSP